MPKTIVMGALSLFILIGILAVFKKKSSIVEKPVAVSYAVEEACKTVEKEEAVAVAKIEELLEASPDESVESVDRIGMLFNTGHSKLPVVETVTYRSRVPWLKGRPAWVTDYASYYATSRHFIARSLNGKEDYLTQKVSTGDRFNVLARDVEFHLVIDLSRCKMWFYSFDKNSNERILLKTYKVGLGRFDKHSLSGLLTPKGVYRLGDKVAIYNPKVMGYFQESEVEMVQVFGSRWIPFGRDDGDDIRGYGIHGAPFVPNDDGEYIEQRDCVGKYDSDGCVRLYDEDIAEIFSI
ncbi:MAG: L,D-transpeptidase, partial [Simkaniaceae bacterium]|nr:L,D-transpeptidase [Simkaniaceae bacterium]